MPQISIKLKIKNRIKYALINKFGGKNEFNIDITDILQWETYKTLGIKDVHREKWIYLNEYIIG